MVANSPISSAEVGSRTLYELVRPTLMRDMLACKRRRRVYVGAHVSLLFENRATAFYQVHELLRAEGRWTAPAVQRALDECVHLASTGVGLVATLMLHGGDAERGRRLCRRLVEAPAETVRFHVDGCTIGAERLSPPDDDLYGPVHYLRFDLGARAARALADPMTTACVVLATPCGVAAAALSAENRAELCADLRDETPVTGAGVGLSPGG